MTAGVNAEIAALRQMLADQKVDHEAALATLRADLDANAKADAAVAENVRRELVGFGLMNSEPGAEPKLVTAIKQLRDRYKDAPEPEAVHVPVNIEGMSLVVPMPGGSLIFEALPDSEDFRGYFRKE